MPSFSNRIGTVNLNRFHIGLTKAMRAEIDIACDPTAPICAHCGAPGADTHDEAENPIHSRCAESDE